MLHCKISNKVGKKRTTIYHHSNFDRTLCSGIMNNKYEICTACLWCPFKLNNKTHGNEIIYILPFVLFISNVTVPKPFITT